MVLPRARVLLTLRTALSALLLLRVLAADDGGDAGARPGARRVPQDFSPLSRQEALAAAIAGGDWILGMQRKGGGFAYEYDPRSDRYDDATVNLPRIAGTARCLAQLAVATGEERFATAAGRALRYLRLRHTRDLPGGPAASFLFEPEGSRLGGTALALLAASEGRGAKRAGPANTGSPVSAGAPPDEEPEVSAWAARLARCLVVAQQPNGKFAPIYKAAEARWVTNETWLYFGEEATLALVRYHRATRDPEWLAAAERGARYLLEVVPTQRAERRPRADAWLMQACLELFDLTNKNMYGEYATAAAEEYLGVQFTAFNAADPADVGGFDDGVPLPMGPTAAARCEGLVAAWRLTTRADPATEGAAGAAAEAAGGREDFRRAISLSLRFQLRHQLTTETAARFVHPERALGGVTLNREDPTLRIDYAQHHVSSLLAWAAALEGK